MYDVQPVSGETWIAPPFGGEIVDLEGFGDCIVSRGIMNSKGPLAGTLSSLESIRRAYGELPVNVKFVVEGEEELGSLHFPQFVSDHRDLLHADAVFFPFYSQDETGKVLLYLGTKGLVFLELIVRGGDWGGPRADGVHGANGAWLHSPTWALVHALATMMSVDQTEILVEGIDDDVTDPSTEDAGHLEALGKTFDPSVPLHERDAARFKFDLGGADLMKKFLLEPNLNINGLVSGHFEPGMKTLLPNEAVAKIDFRLVPSMDPQKVVEALRRHLDNHGFEHVEVVSHGTYRWSKSSINDSANSALLESYRELGFEPEIWPLIPGSAPFYLFTQ
jgi:acetylornithine deacetylase/succinyl-diaminopimelate desuccinylase-like protein